MRGLLQGSSRKEERIRTMEIHGPRFSPALNVEDLDLLRAIEFGGQPAPLICMDQDGRIITADVGGIAGGENFRRFKISRLAALSYVPVKVVTLNGVELTQNRLSFEQLDRAYTRQGELPFEDEDLPEGMDPEEAHEIARGNQVDLAEIPFDEEEDTP